MTDHERITVNVAVNAAAPAQALRDLQMQMQKAGASMAELVSEPAFESELDRLKWERDRPRGEDFECQIRELAKRHPAMTIARAIEVVDGGQAPVLDTLQDRAEFILENHPDIVADIEATMVLGSKAGLITPIKKVRARTHLGLKEAKEAVEHARYLLKQGYMSKAERARLDEESAAAIRSILETRKEASNDE